MSADQEEIAVIARNRRDRKEQNLGIAINREKSVLISVISENQ